jgi:hypothetical protein
MEDPFDKIRCVMSALTPEWEIGASVATVTQGDVTFINGMDAGTRAEIGQTLHQRRQAAAEAAEASEKAAAMDATVLKATTAVSGPLKLKNSSKQTP